jgi:putative GTP pyrophosphokinase
MLPRLLKMVEAIMERNEEDEGSYVKKILYQYRNKRPLYEEFRAAVHKLLETLLKDHNFKYQLTSRTKSPERLREKLIRKSLQGIRYQTLDDIEDLTGVRVLFYSESDKEKFLKILKRAVDGTMNIEPKQQKSGYDATHVIMTFGPRRLALPEYRHFVDLKAEIQITSILRHTWAEIEHDFIYKDISGLKKRDPEKFMVMQEKLGQILDKHIKQASIEFEEVIKLADE